MGRFEYLIFYQNLKKKNIFIQDIIIGTVCENKIHGTYINIHAVRKMCYIFLGVDLISMI